MELKFKVGNRLTLNGNGVAYDVTVKALEGEVVTLEVDAPDDAITTYQGSNVGIRNPTVAEAAQKGYNTVYGNKQQ